MGPKETAALMWVGENEGMAPLNELSPSALNLLKARGLAKPNQGGKRKLQDDCWYLTPQGRSLFDRLWLEDQARIDPETIIPDLVAGWAGRELPDGAVRLRAREVASIFTSFKEAVDEPGCRDEIREAWETIVEVWQGSVSIRAAVLLPRQAAARLLPALSPGLNEAELLCP
ncbi:hypothetical protein [Leisingera caerulea]|uniref:hypothetical protein n=1 Tax=Leisingera caerulea TaxID=506591 RepID=UPI0003FF6FDC|nr:hypothetical protein [Leisingera caerulea]